MSNHSKLRAEQPAETRKTSTGLIILAAISTAMLAPCVSVAQSQELEEIVVTGSRIARTGYAMPTPTTVLDSSDIEASGVTNIADLVRELPALGPGVSDNIEATLNGTVGVNLLDLRGLGGNRTLVLVDGKRQVSNVAGSSQVDINTIPTALVERVEVITGGASAIYGADAVTGVVNFVLNKGFEGVQLDVIGGLYAEEGDGENGNLTLTAGTNFAGGKGNVWGSFTLDDTGQIKGSDRDRVRRQTLFVANPDPAGTAARVLVDDFRIFVASRSGVIFSPTGAVPPFSFAFDDAGNFVPYNPGQILSGGGAIGGDGLNLTSSVQLQPETERSLFNAGGHYDLTDDTRLTFSAKMSRIEGEGFGQAIANVGDLFIAADNAYLPEDLAAGLQAGGHPGVLLFRYNEDLGNVTSFLDSTSYSLSLGLEGQVFNDFDYEVYYQYGRSESDTGSRNVQNIARFQAAADAVRDGAGNIVCRDPVARANGCVPLNLIGYNRMSDAARDYVNTTLTTDNTQQMYLAGGYISGDLFQLPAGSVGVAAGVEWRRETSRSIPEEEALDGSTIFSNSAVVTGAYDVMEVFAEARVPLLAGATLARELNAEAAVRLSDYSTVGRTTTWKFGGDWVPVEDLRFRATYSRASRAPNIEELFSPAEPGQSFVTDPCDVSNRGLGETPEQRDANCTALGLGPDFLSDASFRSVNVVVSGNENLDEEVAKTSTVGVVVTPSALSGLSFSADWWDVSIEDAIDSLDASSVLAGCVDFAGNPELCGLVSRDAEGQIESINVTQLNLASFDARGVDVAIQYLVDLSEDWGISGNAGVLSIDLVGTYLSQLDFLLSESDPTGILREAGTRATPKRMLNLNVGYERSALGINWSSRYVGKSRNGVVPTDADPFYSDAKIYHDLYLRYQLNDSMSGFLGVDNVFETEPPRTISFQQAGHYDTKGRYIYAGFSVRF